MSDDEDFVDDDYEDEWYWAEDANPDIADNLAETAQHSPIPVDDPALELVEIFSDWEYYSDDYYDDDASVVRKLRSTRASPYRSRTKSQGNGDETRNTKKRELARVDDIPELSLDDEETPPPFELIDASSFKGVVWKKSDDAAVQRAQLYEPGFGEKVALLRNWREIFKDSQPKRNGNGIRKSNTTKSASSSNGTATRSRREKTQKISSGSADITPEGHPLSGDVSRADVPQQITEADTGTSFTPPPLSINGAEKPAVAVKTKDGPQRKSTSRLRRTATVQDKPPGASDHAAEPEQRASTKASQQKSTRSDENKKISIAVEVPVLSTAGRRSQRKRRASESVDKETENTQPRPKRAAPARRTKANDQVKEASSPPKTNVRRSTRTRNGQK
ncbi:hypothetical protein C8Q69DRAFT_229158 [Paecilomyces variotii]|uniref:Uncharacterized protein n=1 Tax=Byssochlamys spectabilis TaxID=264951 RepID=A0A443HW32_BYSSP|nr:hypothetical protein C8Q69DRAFT_229158 [Paecilomyces variotii]KAJ9310172.1 hypothetical protein DTO217A2_458 [Paecilomyces variotii]KAJ9347826.1 hypothetical protein DTO027B9_8833 [Paecilomyces variotii]KAJ9357997.1 hypothetical protein DTO280E4_5425 [Paecilomyces variotii]KAJ9372184.1 hypothetical protein DTO282E5_3026 [Paecilomyces variotii]KAJ9378511.1 hypothetical protein DTO063F5_7687 [Paecilomyces variotii]